VSPHAIWTWLLEQFKQPTYVERAEGEVKAPVKYGWFFKAVVACALGLMSTGVQKAFHIASRVDVLDEIAQESKKHAEDAEASASKAKADFDAALLEIQKQRLLDYATFLTRDEFYNYMAPEIRRPKRGG
jgi:hypothetical protein